MGILKIREIKEERMTLVKEEREGLDIEMYFSSTSKIELKNKGISIEDFFEKNKGLFQLKDKDVLVFIYSTFNLESFKKLLLKFGDRTKKSDIYVYTNGEFSKFENN